MITTEEVLEKSLIVFEEAKTTLHDQSNLDSLTQAAKRVAQVKSGIFITVKMSKRRSFS